MFERLPWSPKLETGIGVMHRRQRRRVELRSRLARRSARTLELLKEREAVAGALRCGVLRGGDMARRRALIGRPDPVLPLLAQTRRRPDDDERLEALRR